MVGIKKTKRKMDALIREIAPEDSKEKIYLGYQFPIKNPKIVRKKRGELRITSSVRGQKLNLKFKGDYLKLSKIEDVLLSLTLSSSTEKPIKKVELKEKKSQLRKDLEEKAQYRKRNRMIIIVIIIAILAATSYWWGTLILHLIFPHF